jgi:hypothetical protein
LLAGKATKLHVVSEEVYTTTDLTVELHFASQPLTVVQGWVYGMCIGLIRAVPKRRRHGYDQVGGLSVIANHPGVLTARAAFMRAHNLKDVVVSQSMLVLGQ